MTSRSDFLDTINDITLGFPDNAAAHRILEGSFTMSDYHTLLLSLFHTTHEGPSISALAASRCPWGYEPAREAMLRHAAEGGSHWRWILDDLANTDFQGPDPRSTFPGTEAQAYVAFNYYVAFKAPVGRLGIIAVVDSIARSFGANYSSKLFQCLNLKPHQATFFYRRDEREREPVTDVLERLPMTEDDWQWMVNAARTAGTLYKQIYDAR
jgi:hypothetical protein